MLIFKCKINSNNSMKIASQAPTDENDEKNSNEQKKNE